MAILIPLTIACVTGVVLNHTVDLGLSKRYVTSPWIQKRYGMSLNGQPSALGLNGKASAARWDGQLFYKNNIIADSSPLVGAVPLRDGTAVVTSDTVHYFGLDGTLIETLDDTTLPAAQLSRAGRNRDLALVLETPNGVFLSDANLLGFTKILATKEITWSSSVSPSPNDLRIWKTAFSGDGVPLDRLILDIHSGRFFGTVGKWIYDLVVIGVLLLSGTGLVLFFRTRRRAK